MFTTVQNFISSLETPVNTAAGQAQLNNKVGNVLNDLDQAISHVLDVRAQVGSRLNAIDAQKDINSDIDLHTQALALTVKDLDYSGLKVWAFTAGASRRTPGHRTQNNCKTRGSRHREVSGRVRPVS